MATDCTPSSLAALAAPYRGIAKQERDLVIIALLQAIARTNYTPAQLMELSKCYCGIPDKQLKAIQAALLCVATGGTPPCPECPPSGGCTYQDMQVAWTPTNLKLSENIGFFTYGNFKDPIPDIVFDCVTNVVGFDLESNSQIQTLSWPNLATIDPTNIQNGYFNLNALTSLSSVSLPVFATAATSFSIAGCTTITSISLDAFIGSSSGVGNFGISGNTSLTSLSLPVFVPYNGQNLFIGSNALNQASVDQVLSRCVANPAYVSGIVQLNGGTNAAPSSKAPGSDYDILIGRGVTVTTN